MEFDEEIRDFLIESSENLANLDRDIVQLEQQPEDMELISSVFRTIHTIKGTCGFFGYDILGSVTHIAENILSQVRERQRLLTPELISLILETVDAVKSLLASIEATGGEGEDGTAPLQKKLVEAEQACGIETAPVASPETALPIAVAGPGSEDLSDADEAIHPEGQLSADDAEAISRDEMERVLLPIEADMVEPQAKDPVQGSVSALPAGLVEGDGAAPEHGVELDTQAAAKEVNREAQVADSSIRVDVGLLNRLMNLVGELVLARNQLLQDAPSQAPSLQKTAQRLNLITSELQEGLMKTRMQPVGVVWNKLPRIVRDLASKCGKKIQIEMEGAGTELDKTIIEAIKDPLTHIVRNSCDHGIERPEARLAKNKNSTGTLNLRAYHEGGVVNIEISDDGAGIDPERVKAKAVEKGLLRAEQAAQMSARDALHLIFMPGFSTAEQVTSISGRGVGMDVVKTNIEKIGGTVEVMNRAEGGTTVRIKIPLTLAIIPGLVVTLNGGSAEAQGSPRSGWNREERFIIPQASLLELVRLEGPEQMKRIENVHSTAVFHHRGQLLPLVYLGQILGRSEHLRSSEIVNIIVLQAENRQMGLVVDRICDTQEIVVKPLGKQLKGLSCYVGATIMGDGRPALILDIAGLSRLAGLGLQTRPVTQAAAVLAAGHPQSQMMLLFRAGKFERLAVSLALVNRLEEVDTSRIELAAGRFVLHYRGDILPLITLGQVLDPAAVDETLSRKTAQVIVFTDGARGVGLVVDQILDIVNEAVTVKRASTVPGLLGSAVVGNKITDLVDLNALVQHAGENWLEPSATVSNRRRLLFVDGSAVGREMITEFLDVSGYDVIQAATFSEALMRVGQTPIDLVITAVEIPASEGSELLETLRRNSTAGRIPAIGLIRRADQQRFAPVGEWTFSAHVVRSERAALLAAIESSTTEVQHLRAEAA